MKKVRLHEISIWYRDFNKKYNYNILGNQIFALVNTARINGHFETNQMCRLNVNIHPVTDLNWFKEIDIKKMEMTYRIGSDNINSMLAFIDMDRFLNIQEENERLDYLSMWVQNELIKYFNFYNIEYQDLIEGFRLLKENDFYTYDSKKYLDKNKYFEIWIEKRINSLECLYKLTICDVNTKQVQHYFIGSKKHNFIGEEQLAKMSLDEKLKIIKFFTIDGWKKGNIFHFRWGEEEEYEFHAEELKLYKNGELIS